MEERMEKERVEREKEDRERERQREREREQERKNKEKERQLASTKSAATNKQVYIVTQSISHTIFLMEHRKIRNWHNLWEFYNIIIYVHVICSSSCH